MFFSNAKLPATIPADKFSLDGDDRDLYSAFPTAFYTVQPRS